MTGAASGSVASTPRGRRQDLGARAVAAPQPHDRGPGVVDGDVAQPAGVGTVPLVDGLVRVAHHAQVGPAAPPRLEQRQLQRVDVLHLVHEQVPEAPPLDLGEGRVALDLPRHAGQEVVEVDQPPLPLGRLVGPVGVGDRRPARSPAGARRRRRRPRTARAGRAGRGPTRSRPARRPSDAAASARPAARWPRPSVRADVGQQPLRLGQQLGQAPQPLVGPPPAQHRPRHAVERADRRLLAQAELVEAAQQLAGGPPGEGDGQDVTGVGGARRPPGRRCDG